MAAIAYGLRSAATYAGVDGGTLWKWKRSCQRKVLSSISVINNKLPGFQWTEFRLCWRCPDFGAGVTIKDCEPLATDVTARFPPILGSSGTASRDGEENHMLPMPQERAS